MKRELLTREKVGISVIVLLFVLAVTLGVFLGITSHDEAKYKSGAENVYRHAYYSLMENYMDIETELAKCRVIGGNHMIEEVLTNVAENSALASLSLSTLNTENNDLSSVLKFTNQVGDYAKYLLKKAEKGDMPSDGERETLSKMHDIARKVGEAIKSVRDEVNGDSYHFVDGLGKEQDVFSMAIRDLNNGSVEYPSLIYDGPFSDGLSEKMPANLTGDKIIIDEGIAKVKEFLGEDADVKHVATNTNKFTSYLYDATIRDDIVVSVQVSEIGGHILMFTTFSPEGGETVSSDEACAIGAEMLSKHGYKDMSSVYVSLSHGTYYINYAPKVDGVIYYPDLIKVKVSASTGKVVGMEALSYIYNHIDRDVLRDGVMTESEALEHVTSDIDITSTRLALIPKGNLREILTYEIIGMVDETRYYIYIDAVTGEEVNVLMEITSSGGNLLI